MNGGRLNLRCVPGADTFASFGRLTGAGYEALVVEAPSAGSSPARCGFIFEDLARSGRGTFIFAGPVDFLSGLGGQLIGNPTDPLQRPVLPFGLMNHRIATYEPGVGLRALTDGETSATLLPGHNVRLTSDLAFNGEVAINSLEVSSQRLHGGGTLRVTSGLVKIEGVIELSLDFGAAEGLIFATRFDTLGGAIHGTNGLTFSGENTVTLAGNNTFTGPLTINSGVLQFRSLENLGRDPSPIVLSGGGLMYDGVSALTLQRGIDLRGNAGSIDSSATNGTLTLAGPVTGQGFLRLGNVTLTNRANAYVGTTGIFGTVRFSSDGVFGKSSLSLLGVLAPVGDWMTNRTISVDRAGATIDAGAFNATLQGPLLGESLLVKAGTGRLTIQDGDEFTGPLQVDAGSLRLDGPVGGANAITVGTGARLEGAAAFARPLISSGTIAPGTSIGPLQTGNLWLSGGALELELFAPDAFDQLRVQGVVSFTNRVELCLDFGGAQFTEAFAFPILLNDGTDSVMVSATNRFAIGGNLLEEGEVFGRQPKCAHQLRGRGWKRHRLHRPGTEHRSLAVAWARLPVSWLQSPRAAEIMQRSSSRRARSCRRPEAPAGGCSHGNRFSRGDGGEPQSLAR